MRQQISFLTQSRFYSPAFNAAIFDGPVRIYFAQYQEPHALKVYFKVQQRMKDLNTQMREAIRRMGVNIFVMLYPNHETFEMSFIDAEPDSVIFGRPNEISLNKHQVIVARLGRDFVVGSTSSENDGDVQVLCDRIFDIANSLLDVMPAHLIQPPLDGEENFA